MSAEVAALQRVRAATILSPADASRLDPFISIVVPIRNEEATIERLARSLLDQDYPHDRYEILMADGGSTDRTRELLAMVDAEARIACSTIPAARPRRAERRDRRRPKGDIVDARGRSLLRRAGLPVTDRRGDGGDRRVGRGRAGPDARRHAVPSGAGRGSVLEDRGRRGARTGRCSSPRLRRVAADRLVHARRVLDQVGPFDESARGGRGSRHEHPHPQGGLPARFSTRRSVFGTSPRPSLPALWRQIYTVGLVKARILRKHPDIFKWKYVAAHRVRRGCSPPRVAAALVREADRARRSCPPLSWNRPGVRALSRAASRRFRRARLVADPARRSTSATGSAFSRARPRRCSGRTSRPSGRAVSDRHEARVLLADLSPALGRRRRRC